MGEQFSIPDFVVVGGYVNGEVVLIASNKMSQAQLTQELRYPDLMERYDRVMREPEYDIQITAKVYDYVMVRGRDYPEAWKRLFEFWTPEAQFTERKEIPEQKQIEDLNYSALDRSFDGYYGMGE